MPITSVKCFKAHKNVPCNNLLLLHSVKHQRQAEDSQQHIRQDAVTDHEKICETHVSLESLDYELNTSPYWEDTKPTDEKQQQKPAAEDRQRPWLCMSGRQQKAHIFFLIVVDGRVPCQRGQQQKTDSNPGYVCREGDRTHTPSSSLLLSYMVVCHAKGHKTKGQITKGKGITPASSSLSSFMIVCRARDARRLGSIIIAMTESLKRVGFLGGRFSSARARGMQALNRCCFSSIITAMTESLKRVGFLGGKFSTFARGMACRYSQHDAASQASS